MSLEGILNIDKPAGMTSHDVVARIRRIAGMKRVGHAGTLDPLATGVLLVCLGRATRVVEYLVGRPKIYEATIRLGQSTDTYDSDGEITQERPLPADLTESRLCNELSTFHGDIQQIPPMYSAIKRNGQPLYKLARQGIEVERKARSVTVYDINLISWNAPILDLRIRCSAGTYIRSIAHDLGELVGCGGHLTQLRRTAIGEYTASNGLSLDDLTSDLLVEQLKPADSGISHFKRIDLDAASATGLLQGKLPEIRTEEMTESSDKLYRAYDPFSRFIGIIKPQSGRWRAVKMFMPLDE